MQTMTQASTDYILRTTDIVKRYKGVVALDHVSIHIRRGTIHGLLGENGAGKSTLVSLISGLIAPTEGQILFDGEEVQGSDVKQMEARGVFLVTQEPMIVESMSVADNLMLGHWPVKRGMPGVVDQRALHADALRALVDTGLDPAMPAARLSAVEKRKLNILRALFSGGKLLILDEPTAALTLADREHLFDFMRDLKAGGVSFVFISHYNEEILGICDAVSVLRNGRLAGEMTGLESIDSDALSELVIGRDVPLFHRQNPVLASGSGWRIEGLRAAGVEIDRFEIAPRGDRRLCGAARFRRQGIRTGAVRPESRPCRVHQSRGQPGSASRSPAVGIRGGHRLSVRRSPSRWLRRFAKHRSQYHAVEPWRSIGRRCRE